MDVFPQLLKKCKSYSQFANVIKTMKGVIKMPLDKMHLIFFPLWLQVLRKFLSLNKPHEQESIFISLSVSSPQHYHPYVWLSKTLGNTNPAKHSTVGKPSGPHFQNRTPTYTNLVRVQGLPCVLHNCQSPLGTEQVEEKTWKQRI